MRPQAVSVIDVERVYDGWQHSLWRGGVVVVNVCVDINAHLIIITIQRRKGIRWVKNKDQSVEIVFDCSVIHHVQQRTIYGTRF